MLSPIAEAAGYTFDKLDAFLGKLGEPYGVAAYKPYHSSGEMYIHNYVGMVGILWICILIFLTTAEQFF